MGPGLGYLFPERVLCVRGMLLFKLSLYVLGRVFVHMCVLPSQSIQGAPSQGSLSPGRAGKVRQDSGNGLVGPLSD